jgi:hypothetical protein
MTAYLTRRTLPSGTHAVPMATDAAPTFGFEYITPNILDIPTPTVFASLITKTNAYRLSLTSHAALLALKSWANYTLDQGMTSPAELGGCLSIVPNVEHLVIGMLTQLPDSMVQRIFAGQRHRFELT